MFAFLLYFFSDIDVSHSRPISILAALQNLGNLLLTHPDRFDMQIDDADRRSRQLFEDSTNGHHQAIRERAASQPPHLNDSFSSSPLLGLNHGLRNGGGEQQQPTWPQQSRFAPLSHSSSLGHPQSVPTRSSSFSASQDRPHANSFLSVMRDNPRFGSTFEDDESEALSDSFSSFDDMPLNGRLHPGQYGSDSTRSRSQSLLVSQPASAELSRNWARDSPHGRYPTSRYNNGMGSQESNFLNASSTPTAIPGRGGNPNADISNISPFTRDIHQILLLGDRSAIRDQVGPTMGPPGQRDDPSGGASGSTSRRHSVSYYHPRRDIGFQAPGSAANDDNSSSMLLQNPYHSNVLSDEELASDLNMLSIGMDSLTVSGAHSQPSSLPNFPQGRSLLSQSPDSANANNRYLPMRPAEFNKRTSFSSSSHLDSTSASDRATSASPRSDVANPFGVPTRHPPELKMDYTGSLSPSGAGTQRYGQQQFASTTNSNTGAMPTSPVYGQRTPSFGVPASPVTSPLSPGLQNSLSRVYNKDYLSSAAPPSAQEPLSPTLADLGKGVPLHSVPPSCPLFIVEFKAGRTDLFYTMERAHDIHAGDLVIVEADRGKDLGKVVNDSITLAEVEAFQKAQAQKAMHAASLMDGPPAKRDINPKKIYGKAQPQDTQ